MSNQKSLCCHADIKLTGKERPDAFECTKCGRIIGSELPTEKTLERSVEEKKDWNDKLYEWFTHYCDEDTPYNALHTIVLGAIQAERQRCEEMVEAERERIYNYLATRDLPDEDGCSPVLTAREMAVELKQALTQPNNPK